MENDIILKVEKLSKQYRLGTVGTGTISHDLNRFLARIRGKEDPYLKIGESNDRASKGNSEYVWALKDVNFEVKRGEVLGIIGKNGAGKSTLLKILSKVTGPTTGSIKSKGRIASLLEVGTGFHPEMTGKENIFLNGAILGMTKKEIQSKLNEIVSFSGCERYIDTPVKRYSSGMKVRLAFAVAAHLEPDILVVDEVLAVGDAEFQKKAIGKMQDISGSHGRTVLFVSHNMSAVESLCTKVISLHEGTIHKIGEPTAIISDYLQNNIATNSSLKFDSKESAIGNSSVRITYAAIENSNNATNNTFDVSSELKLKLKLYNLTSKERIYIGFDLLTTKGDVIFGSGNKFNCSLQKSTEIACHLPANFLNDNQYQIFLYILTDEMKELYTNKELLTFDVKDVKRDLGYLGKINGLIRPKLNWVKK